MSELLDIAGYYIKRPAAIMKAIFGTPAPALGSMDYTEYWRKRGELGYSRRYAIFSRLIERGSSVLDIGCGDGSAIKHLERENAINGEGLDISETGVLMARGKGVKASVADVSSAAFEIKGVYDYIIISEVLEHIPRPEDLARKTRGHFRKGLIVSIPNTGHYIHRLRLLFGRFPVQWTLHPGEHLRFWTLTDFESWADWLGFMIVGRASNTGFTGLYKLLPGLFADNFIFLLKEKAVRRTDVH